MYKSKLQELCQKKSWSVPKYSTTKHGLDHNPAFSATVLVNDESFHTFTLSKSSKEAQNDAAKLAFDHFSLSTPDIPNLRPSIPPPSSFPQPSLTLCLGSLGATADEESIHVSTEILHQKTQETHIPPQADDEASGVDLVQENKKFRDVQHLYKSELQIYAQKKNIVFPVYSSEREGPPHSSRFKCSVTIDGRTYECSEFFLTLKEAEHAAAKVALTALSPEGVQNDDSAIYKNLLQEIAQKGGLQLPTYTTQRSGEVHSPFFVSSVEVKGENFVGQEAKTKKQAEISAAKVAYNALKERNSKSIQIPPLSTYQQAKQAPELLPSCTKPNISASLQQHARPNMPMTLNPITTSMPKAEDTTGKETTNILDGLTPENIPYPSPCKSTDALSSPFTSNGSSDSAVDSGSRQLSGKISLAYKKIIVYPANKPIPNGSTTLSFSDDNWTAFCPPEATC